MESLLVCRERILNFFAKYEIYIRPVLKFFLSLALFFVISDSFGYNSLLGNPGVYLILALICMFIPKTGSMYMIAIYALTCVYSISIEYFLVAFLVILFIMLLYMQFSPEHSYLIIITAAACLFNLAPAVAVAAGFLVGFPAIVPIAGGMIIYYVFRFVPVYIEKLNLSEVSSGIEGIQYIIKNALVDSEMLILLVALVFTIVIIAAIKKLKLNHSWNIATFTGVITYILVVLIGKGVMNIQLDLLNVLFGAAVAIMAGVIIIFIFRNLNYKAVEKVQFEDDEYYYYVKAVPKKTVEYVKTEKDKN